MKILLTLHEYLLPNTGASGSTLSLGNQYTNLGHEVFYYSYTDLPKFSIEIKDLVFPEFTALKLLKVYKKFGIDVIDSSTGDNWLWGTLFRKHRQRPLLVTRSHGLEHLEHLERLEDVRRGDIKSSWRYPLYRGSIQLQEIAQSLRCSDMCFFLNNQESKYAVNNLEIKPDKVYVFPNGMPDEFLGLPFKSTPNANDAIIRIAQIGTYIQRKGSLYSGIALNKILMRYPNVEVSFIGTQVNEIGTPEQVYADFEPTVRDRVKVIPYFEHRTLPSLLQDHHIKLFPTLSEGFGKALIEAMACGLAPVTTPTPGPKDIVQDEQNGILIPARDSLAIEIALEKLICNRSYLNTLRRNAYKTAQKYSWFRIAQDRLLTYEKGLTLLGLG